MGIRAWLRPFLVVMVASVLAVGLLAGVAHADEGKVVWKESGSTVTCTVDGAKQAGGIKSIDGKRYYFDKKGIQRTGWQKIGSAYYYFAIGHKAKGAMVTSKVINGVKLGKDGKAVLNSESKAELNILVKATKFVEATTKPLDSKTEKLKKCFYRLKNDYKERSLRSLKIRSGWHRAYALDIFDKKMGDCHAYGAAFAYVANAIGCKKCAIVCSGGHSWSEVDGKVYDVEWSKQRPADYFAFPYSKSGTNGAPRYKSSRAYVVTIAPQSKALKGTSAKAKTSATSKKNGLVKSDGARYYYKNGKAVASRWMTIRGSKYYFRANGKAATGSVKIKGKHHVFSTTGKLLTGKKTRVVKVGTEKYRVTKQGLAKPGRDSAKRYFNAKGKMITSPTVIGGKLCAYKANGAYDAAKTRQLRAAAKMEADATPLLALLGKPQKERYVVSCDFHMTEDGELLPGKGGILTYPDLTVYTFKTDDGAVYYRGAEAR